VRARLQDSHDVVIPQSRPLSAGEILGCTAPRLVSNSPENGKGIAKVVLEEYQTVMYVGDGRFHLEAMMMANPDRSFFKYDPYTHICTREELDFGALRAVRLESMQRAMESRHWGVLIGAIGRQGNPAIAEGVVRILKDVDVPYTVVVMDEEISEARLQAYPAVEAWVQIACPRLSLDWGYAFSKPLLTPYEFYALYRGSGTLPEDHLPMDYYAHNTQGPWGNYHLTTKDRQFDPEAFK
jgi:2-(3-amino-3-carboxypropyl)histidine synthase